MKKFLSSLTFHFIMTLLVWGLAVAAFQDPTGSVYLRYGLYGLTMGLGLTWIVRVL